MEAVDRVYQARHMLPSSDYSDEERFFARQLYVQAQDHNSHLDKYEQVLAKLGYTDEFIQEACAEERIDIECHSKDPYLLVNLVRIMREEIEIEEITEFLLGQWWRLEEIVLARAILEDEDSKSSPSRNKATL